MSKRFLIVIIVIGALFALKKYTDQWTGIIYPDKSNLSNFKNIGEFKSLEQCRNEAISVLYKIVAEHKGDFECGLNCKGVVCEETSK